MRTYLIPPGDATPPGRGVSLSPTDAGILAVTASCPLLESLQIGGNSDNTLPKVTNACLVDIARRCPRLACVSFEHTYNVNDAALAELARLPRLSSLSLLHTRVTSAGAIAAIKTMPALSLVHIFSSVVSVAPDALREVALLPAMRSVCFSLDNAAIGVRDALDIIARLKPGFQAIGAFPPTLDALRENDDVKKKGVTLLFTCDSPGQPAKLSWLQCLNTSGNTILYGDGSH